MRGIFSLWFHCLSHLVWCNDVSLMWWHWWHCHIMMMMMTKQCFIFQVQIYDQIIFESVKSPGQYFHASAPWKIDNFSVGWFTCLCFLCHVLVLIAVSVMYYLWCTMCLIVSCVILYHVSYCTIVLLWWTEPKLKPRCFATFRRRRHRDGLGLKRHSVCAFWYFNSVHYVYYLLPCCTMMLLAVPR